VPPSFDKQPVRDWAEGTGWDKESPPPTVPDDVLLATRARYIAAYEQISGRSFSDWWGGSGRAEQGGIGRAEPGSGVATSPGPGAATSRGAR
jgi:hypothetical protein